MRKEWEQRRPKRDFQAEGGNDRPQRRPEERRLSNLTPCGMFGVASRRVTEEGDDDDLKIFFPGSRARKEIERRKGLFFLERRREEGQSNSSNFFVVIVSVVFIREAS